MSTTVGILLGFFVTGQLQPATHLDALAASLKSPARIGIAADGTVSVTDPSNNRVARYDASGAALGTWPVAEGPIGIAVHPDGRYFVSLRDIAKVAIHDASFARIGFLGDGNPLVSFVQPTDIAIAGDTGRIYVVDSGGDRIYAFEGDGTLALIFGVSGEGFGQFQYPSAIAVDEVNQRLVVADHDNFRVQVFNTSGVFLWRFGYRIKYGSGGTQEGWMPRTQGLAIDQNGTIYVTDAVMSTLRLFDPTGRELGKVLEYGFGPGDLRTPCDIALSRDELRMYVASTGTSSVEVYATPTLSMPATTAGSLEHEDDVAPAGFNPCRYDLRNRRHKTMETRSLRERPQNHGPMNALLDAVADIPAGYDGPHMINAAVMCGRCHGIDGQPGGHPGLLEGQTVLCMSCHNAGGQALLAPIHERDIADPYGTNPNAPDGRGSAHAWGVSAISADADSIGPAAGSSLAQHLDGGLIKCSTCHNQHNSDADTPYLRRRNDQDQMCKECHAPRDRGPGERGTHPVGFAYPDGQGEFPLAADVTPLLIKNGNVECMTCHALHDADSGGANGGDGDGMLLRVANNATLCRTCHTDHVGHTPTGSWQPTCIECHEPHDPDNNNLSLVTATVHNQTLGVDKPVVFTARTGMNSFDDGDPAVNDGICQVCHTATAYHRHNGTGVPHNDGANCTLCHPHRSGFMPTGGGSCVSCHSSPQDNGDNVPPGGRPAIVNADGSGGHHLAGGVLTNGDCVTCHEMSQHQAGTVRLWLDPNSPTTPLPLTGDPAELVPFCSNCHDNQTHPIVHTTGAAWEPVCTQCHELHDPANGNLSLVNDLVRNETLGVDKPVVFTARTGANSFDDGVGANDGICQVCHTVTQHHLEDGTGIVHNNGADCTSCHPHPSGFLPTNASCQDCHAVAQGGRRAVIGEFGLSSHHLQGASLDDADCVVCHDMSQHQAGQVRLKDVDDPTNPAKVVSLSADPTVNPAEAVKLEAFCLACHDTDGAGGAAPFTDGMMPAPIDASLWAGGSHKTGTMTCFGDGQTIGCHDTGHGSRKRNLLAPSDLAAVPPANVEEEEGFCYGCHDATGPASTDIASLFTLASHHNVSFADQADGSKVECTNCHNPHTASSSALLIDPDTGAAWAGGDPSFCLACHDGTPPPGVTFPASAPGTGYDKSAFVGTTHATQLGGNTCRHCHLDHGSQYHSMLREQYVVADNNAYSWGNGDYATCWLCHDEDTIVRDQSGNKAQNAFKDLHDKHVRGEDAPCMICHDVHRPFDAGEPLIDLDFAAQRPGSYDLQFIDGKDGSTSFWLSNGDTRGNCYLSCHGKDHTPKSYDHQPSPPTDCSICHTP